MDFDWGGFVGGIIGGFGAVFLTYKIDEIKRHKPMIQKKKLEVLANVVDVLRKGVRATSDILKRYEEDRKDQGANDFEKVFVDLTSTVLYPLTLLLPAAYEAEQDMFQHVYGLKEEVRQFLTRYGRDFDNDGRKIFLEHVEKEHIVRLASELNELCYEKANEFSELINKTASAALK